MRKGKSVQSLSEVSLSDFKQALTQEQIRTLQIIFSMMAAGVLLFAFIVLLAHLYRASMFSDPSWIQGMNVMSIVNAAVAIIAFASGKLVADKQFSDSNLAKAVAKNYTNREGNSMNLTEAQKCVMIIRIAFIIRIATMEQAAFFGLIATLVAITNGVGIVEPIYFLNAVSALPVLIYIAINFPSSERLEEIFITKIKKSA